MQLCERKGCPGSPPRRRGKGPSRPGDTDNRRITPAWAGKRKNKLIRNRLKRDHPRMGGEKCYDVVPRFGGVGSPPRRRGKVPNARCFIERQRITPAWAGKSAFRFQSQKASQDHPRVGGEKKW